MRKGSNLHVRPASLTWLLPEADSENSVDTSSVSCLFLGELHRISVCYSSGKVDDDTFTFSDDQSSGQVLHSLYFELTDLICPSVREGVEPFNNVINCLQDDCSEDGTLAEDSVSSDAAAAAFASKQNLCKQ